MRAAFLLVALAACEAAAPEAEQAAAPVAAPEETAGAPAEPAAPALPPPPRYVGRWAASADLCPTGWWRFWHDELRTGEGETRCDILPPDGASGDTRRRAVCTSEGELSREEWEMTYPAENTMTISRDGAAPVTLTKC